MNALPFRCLTTSTYPFSITPKEYKQYLNKTMQAITVRKSMFVTVGRHMAGCGNIFRKRPKRSCCYGRDAGRTCLELRES